MTMKKYRTSKQLQRMKIEQETQAFLELGGRIDKIENGVSGLTPGKKPFFQFVPSDTPNRKPGDALTDVMRQIDARKKSKPASKSPPPRRRRPQKKLIRDDFGEPLRWVWEDDSQG